MKRWNIAFCVDRLIGAYPEALWLGLMEKAQELNINIFLLPGGGLDLENQNDFLESIMYKYLSSRRIDGFILTATVYTKYNSSSWVRNYFSSFNKPFVSIGVDMKGIPCTLIENTAGLISLLDHFIKDHGYRKIAFIRGPVNNGEAEIRFKCYREALERYNIPFDEKLTAIGTFDQDSGEEAMKKILFAIDGCPEAVVAANDYMAIGAFDVLHDRGFNVPQDCALGGFDNISEGEFLDSPLTTVVQPLEKQAGLALEQLIRLLNGEAEIPNITERTELMIRNSCGCLSRTIMEVSHDRLGICKEGNLSPADISKIFPSLYKKAHDTLEISKELFELLSSPVFNKNLEEKIIREFERLLSGQIGASISMRHWNSFLSCLYHLLKKNRDSITFEQNEFFQKLRVMIGEFTEHVMTHEKNMQEDSFTVLREVLLHLISSFNIDSMTANIGRDLPRLGFPSFHITSYDRDKILEDQGSFETLPEKSTLKIAYLGENEGIKAREIIFKTMDIVPDGYLPEDRCYTYLIRPLFFENKHFGIILTEIGPRKMVIHESIRSQISGAIQASLTYEENTKRENEAISKREQIQELISPIMASINSVAAIANERTAAMKSIANSAQENTKIIDESSNTIADMNDSAKAIQNMIKGILDISEQIHLLSINTSIEATKAGEHGRGFSVIAQEIKKLANATASNIENIESNLDLFIESINKSSSANEKTSVSYNEMISDIEQAAGNLEEIAKQMGGLLENSNSIIEIMKN